MRIRYGTNRRLSWGAAPYLRSRHPYDYVDDLDPVAPASELGSAFSTSDGSPVAPADALPPGAPTSPLERYKELFEAKRAFRRDFFTHQWPVSQEDKVDPAFQKYFDHVDRLRDEGDTETAPADR